MRTEKQQLASIQNGKKSLGPVTAEGKARSAQNAVKHGFHARAVVLTGESKQKYEELSAEYQEYWQPETRLEYDLVNDIATNRWRLNRLIAIETARLDVEIDRQRAAIDSEFTKTDECTRAALAYTAVADTGNALLAMSRQETRFRRTIDRATSQLLQLKNQKCKNKPNAL